MNADRVSKAALLPICLLVFAGGCDEGGVGALMTGVEIQTSSANAVFDQVDRLGNPLLSEVLVKKAHHGLYNNGTPESDVAAWTGAIETFVTETAGRDPAVGSTLASLLLPDMLLVYPARDPTTVGWLSWAFGGYGGRPLSQDVVDLGLMAIFGPLLDPDDVTPGLTTDNVDGNDVPFLPGFPYLAPAH